MVINIVTEEIKETRFLSQVSRSYLSNLDGEPSSQIKDGRKMPKMQMAAFFGKSLLVQLLHYLKAMFGVKIRIFKVKESIYVDFKLTHIQKCCFFWTCMPILLTDPTKRA